MRLNRRRDLGWLLSLRRQRPLGRAATKYLLHDADTRGFGRVVDWTQSAQWSDDVKAWINNSYPYSDPAAVMTERIVLTGNNFGPKDKTWNVISAVYNATASSGSAEGGNLALDSYVATDCYVSVDDVEAVCSLVEGAGHSHEWSVTVGEQRSQTPTSSYGTPEIWRIEGAGEHYADGANGYDTIGGQVVTLWGRNFGPYADGATVTYGITGSEYKPTNCKVIDHGMITCTTVAGVGADLFWRVEVRGQANALSPDASTSYTAPSLLSVYSEPDKVEGVQDSRGSAAGSRDGRYMLFLRVQNSGLSDRNTKRVLRFGLDELQFAAESPQLTRQDGKYEILAFEAPKLMNRKQAAGVPMSIDVFPSDRITGAENRALSRTSLNNITWSYDTPVIKQYTVVDHTVPEHVVLTLIGSSFGSILDGPNSDDMYRMKINEYSANGQAYDPPRETTMKYLNQNISQNTGNYVHSWEEGAENNRFDRIVLVWEGMSGKLSISRGGDESLPISFFQQTPQILSMKLAITDTETDEKTYPEPPLAPTLGDNAVEREVRLEITCRYCGNPPVLTKENIPRDVFVKLGSVSGLEDDELHDCAIVSGSV